MVDLKSKNSIHSCSVKELIANLKRQHENSQANFLADFVNKPNSLENGAALDEKDINLSSLKTTQKCCNTVHQNKRSKLDDGPQKLQSNIKDYFNVVKKETYGESSRNKVLAIINALKNTTDEGLRVDNLKTVGTSKKDVQCLSNNLSTIISKANLNRNNAFYESQLGRDDGRDLNTNTEIVRKTTNCRQNNQRIKLSAVTHKQLNVSDFFNIKDPNDDMDNKSCNVLNMVINRVKCSAQDEYTTTDKFPVSTVLCEKSSSKQHDTENTHPRGSSLSEDKIFDCIKTFRHIKKCKKLNTNESLAKSKVHRKPFESLQQKSSTNADNGTVSKKILDEKPLFLNILENKNEGACKISFDDFCENISKVIRNDSGKSEYTELAKNDKLSSSKQCKSLNKENQCFPKSFSTGNMIKGKQSHNCEELHSMPTTQNEVKNRKERLEKNKITFDDFVENILQNLNCKNITKNEQSRQNVFDQNECHLQSECDLNIKTKQTVSNVEGISTKNVNKSAVKEKTVKSSQRSNNFTEDVSKHILVTPKGDSTYCTNSVITNCNLQNSKFPSTNYFANINFISSNDVSTSGNLKHASNSLQNYEKDERDSEDSLVYFTRSEILVDSLPKVKSLNTKTTNMECVNEETASVDFFTYFSQSRSANRLSSKGKTLNTKNTNSEYENEKPNSTEFQQKQIESRLLPKGKSLNTENTSGCENEETESIDFLTYFPPGCTASTPLFKEKVVDKLDSEIKNVNTLSDREYTENKNNNLHSEKLLQSNLLRHILEKDCNSAEILSECYTGRGIENVDYLGVTANKGNHFVDVEELPEKSMNESSGSIPKDDLANCELSEKTQIGKTNKESESDRDGTLEEFFKSLLQEYTKKIGNIRRRTDIYPKKKCCIKRYRKGKIKIYRLRRLKKSTSKTETIAEVNKNINFTDVYKKITQDFVESDNNFPMSPSTSSVSTASSYITDVTTSEILSPGSNELTSPQQRLRKGINDLSKDKSLLYCEQKLEDVSEDNKEEIKMKIQEVFLKVAEDFTRNNHSSLKLRRQKFDNCIIKEGRLQLRPVMESSMTVINSAGQRSKTKFKLMLYIMKKIQVLLETDTKLTKRELYYQLKTLLNDQRVVDRAINAVSCLLNVGMWALNIIAQKGLVFGNLKILLSSGETLNCNIPGTLIPQDVNEIVEIQSVAYFILVVEKESIFYKLIEEGLPNRLTRPFIMITGKGFPDLNTQLFLKKLWVIMSIPVFILVDADPHGINIMLNYRYGSVNNAHVSHYLAVPNAKWLGVYPSEVTNLNLTRELLSERELKLVNHLLKTPYVEYNPKIAGELKVLLEKKYKAEIEGLIKSDSYLSQVYLPNKFFTHNFI